MRGWCRQGDGCYRCAGEHCSPLRLRLCRWYTSGAPRSSHPTVTPVIRYNSQVPSAATRPTSCATRVCRACVDETVCVAARYLTLRIGREMGGHIGPPLRKMSGMVVSFGKSQFSDRQTLRGNGVIHKRGGNLGVYPLVRPPRRQEPFAYPAKNSRPLETNTLTQFVSPSHPVPRKAAQNSRCAGTAKNTKKQPPEGDCLHFVFTLRCS